MTQMYNFESFIRQSEQNFMIQEFTAKKVFYNKHYVFCQQFSYNSFCDVFDNLIYYNRKKKNINDF